MIPRIPRYLAVLLLLTTLGLGSCNSRNKQEPVDYDDLGWKKNVYYLEDQPFDGSAVQFHSDGSIKGQWEFRKGVPHGKVTEFDEAGTRIAQTHYRDGLRHGENTYWDRNGSPIKFQIFKAGKLVSSEASGSLQHATPRQKNP